MLDPNFIIEQLIKECPKVSVEESNLGLKRSGIIGRSKSGEIALRVDGVINKAAAKKFRAAYARALEAKLI